MSAITLSRQGMGAERLEDGSGVVVLSWVMIREFEMGKGKRPCKISRVKVCGPRQG